MTDGMYTVFVPETREEFTVMAWSADEARRLAIEHVGAGVAFKMARVPHENWTDAPVILPGVQPIEPWPNPPEETDE